MKKFNFVYVTTNLINGRHYVGEHSTDILEDDYLGSGYNLFKAISKYSKKNFKREILEFCQSKEEAFNLQEKYIIKYKSLSPNGYNISPKGGHNVKNCFSQESKNKISKANKGKQPWLGKHHSEEAKNKIGQKELGNTKFKGKKHSKESREKISNSLKGKPPWNIGKKLSEDHKAHLRKPKSEEHKASLRKPKSEKGKQNIKLAHNTADYLEKLSKIHKGKKYSTETKQKMSSSAKNRKPISEETRKKMSESQKRRFSKNNN